MSSLNEKLENANPRMREGALFFPFYSFVDSFATFLPFDQFK
jgi:hypothetical protein